MNTGNFRNGNGSNNGGGGRFGGSDRGLFLKILNINPILISNFYLPAAPGGGNRFNDRGGSNNRGGFNDRRGNGNMDRRGGNGNGGMRDYVDPWAHNGNNGNSPMMGGGNGNGGPLSNFAGMGNGNNGIGSLGSLGNNAGPNNQNNGGGGGFGNNMDIDKTSTQVTIPKDVSW